MARMTYQDENLTGRDFVIGDLHGHRALLETMLEKIGFDISTDRLFSVGDLVDRGPDSLNTLALVQEPWFFPVMGNHEYVLLSNVIAERWDSRQYDPAQIRNFGSEWFFDLDSAEHEKLLDLAETVRMLPLVRVVGQGAGRFQVVHAELSAWESSVAYQVTDADIDGGMKNAPTTFITGAGQEGDWVLRALWGRSLITRARRDSLLPPPRRDCSPIFCGHSVVQQRPMQIGRHLIIDTGCGMAPHPFLGLSVVCPAMGQGWVGNAEEIREILL